ncbi:hypothetical protein BDR26DRAFT_453839 [Obelidium mucronatum]|nr:hypothetical protein BDR26DRAFT_453839 [Obelidium mucronatum]
MEVLVAVGAVETLRGHANPSTIQSLAAKNAYKTLRNTSFTVAVPVTYSMNTYELSKNWVSGALSIGYIRNRHFALFIPSPDTHNVPARVFRLKEIQTETSLTNLVDYKHRESFRLELDCLDGPVLLDFTKLEHAEIIKQGLAQQTPQEEDGRSEMENPSVQHIRKKSDVSKE